MYLLRDIIHDIPWARNKKQIYSLCSQGPLTLGPNPCDHDRLSYVMQSVKIPIQNGVDTTYVRYPGLLRLTRDLYCVQPVKQYVQYYMSGSVIGELTKPSLWQ